MFTYSHVHNPCAARFERALHRQTAPSRSVLFVCQSASSYQLSLSRSLMFARSNTFSLKSL